MNAHHLHARRQRLSQSCPDTLLVFEAAPPGGHRPYVPSSALSYLSGIEEEGCALMLWPDGRSVLYVQPRDPDWERWHHERLGPQSAGQRSGIDEVRPTEDFERDLKAALTDCSSLGWALGQDLRRDAWLLDALHSTGRQRRSQGMPDIVDPGRWLGQLRLRKDAQEVDAMRRAGHITAAAMNAAMEGAAAGMTELELSGLLTAALRRAGAARDAFETLVASGPRTCGLHAQPTARQMNAGQLVLVDFGARWGGYAADMSRTWLLGGPGTTSQATGALLEAVKEAHRAAIAMVAPGVSLKAVHQRACEVLHGAQQRLGLEGPLGQWFPHQTSHWIGLDVHDPCPREQDGASIILEPGMTLTIEPGLYVPQGAQGAPKALHGAGARWEDTVLVTQDGAQVLTSAP